MTGLPKNFIALLGALLAAGIIAIGVLVLALPIFTQAQATRDQTANVRTQNDLQQTIIDALAAQRDNLDELQASVDTARALVPTKPDFSGLSAEVFAAAAGVGGSVVSFMPGATNAYVPGAASDAAGTSEPSASDPNAATTADPSATAPTPQASGANRSLVAISVTVPTADAAAGFIDALRSGARAVEIVDVAVSSSGGGFSVAVNAAIFSKAGAS